MPRKVLSLIGLSVAVLSTIGLVQVGKATGQEISGETVAISGVIQLADDGTYVLECSGYRIGLVGDVEDLKDLIGKSVVVVGRPLGLDPPAIEVEVVREWEEPVSLLPGGTDSPEVPIVGVYGTLEKTGDGTYTLSGKINVVSQLDLEPYVGKEVAVKAKVVTEDDGVYIEVLAICERTSSASQYVGGEEDYDVPALLERLKQGSLTAVKPVTWGRIKFGFIAP